MCQISFFLSFFPPFLSSLNHLFYHSGAEGLRVCRFICPDRWWQWHYCGHLYCWAGPAPCWGVLGVQPFWPVRSAAIWRSQRHDQHTSELPLAAHTSRPGPHTHLCGPPPGSTEWLQDPLPAQCAVWVPYEWLLTAEREPYSKYFV